MKSKKKKKKKKKKLNGVVKIPFDNNNVIYTDEEFEKLIEDLNFQVEQLSLIKEKYYSNNAYIERINKRSFMDILFEKQIGLIGQRKKAGYLFTKRTAQKDNLIS